jgi:predicted DNA-binding protein
MGRPPLDVKAITIRLSPDVIERIDAITGTHGRAAFIRKAVEYGLHEQKSK